MIELHDVGIFFVTIGGLFLLGLAMDILGRRTALPRVTLLLVIGVIIGAPGFNLLPEESVKWYPFISNIALVMVGFLIGGKLSIKNLSEQGMQILCISLSVVVSTVMVVGTGLWLLGTPLPLALLLGSIATATDPAATEDTIKETNSKGPFSNLLSGIVALDDAWGLIAFSLILVIAELLVPNGSGDPVVLHVLWELGGGIFIGVAVGLPAALMTGRLEQGEPTQAEALGIVFLCGGLAMLFDVSYLISAITMGAVITNTARHHKRPFHAIEGIEWPFLILFFILAGATADLTQLKYLGSIGIGYIVLRITGRLAGAWLGGKISHASPIIRNWMGWSLMPQAGIAMGIALVASQRMPEFKDEMLAVVISSTILFEIIGPILTRLALKKSGEIQAGTE